jgi:hypothetical protein
MQSSVWIHIEIDTLLSTSGFSPSGGSRGAGAGAKTPPNSDRPRIAPHSNGILMSCGRRIRSISSLARRPLALRRPLILRRQQSVMVSGGGGGGSGDSASTVSEASNIPALELRRWFLVSAVPMVGFGFVDNTVMIHAGHFIDLTLGVTFGLSTLAAAACGQICSDVCGVAGGAQLEAAFARLGLPRPRLSPAQKATPLVQRVGLLGQIVGVFVGCSLGLVNLCFIDASGAAEIKAISRERSAFSVRLSNDERDDATAVTVEGPDVSMLIASLTAVLASHGCDVSDFTGGVDKERQGCVRDVFYVTRSGEQLDSAELESLARAILDASAGGSGQQSLTAANATLRSENVALRAANEALRRRLSPLPVSVAESKGGELESGRAAGLFDDVTQEGQPTSRGQAAQTHLRL